METNFFGYVLSGVEAFTDLVLIVLPFYTPIGLVPLVSAWMGSTPVLLGVFVTQFINLSLPMAITVVILIAEGVRLLLAAWQWIKNAIPMA